LHSRYGIIEGSLASLDVLPLKPHAQVLAEGLLKASAIGPAQLLTGERDGLLPPALTFRLGLFLGYVRVTRPRTAAGGNGFDKETAFHATSSGCGRHRSGALPRLLEIPSSRHIA
jgi:hypothetical protein